MEKKRIKEILKKFNMKMIDPSYFENTEDHAVLFKAYDKLGTVSEFFINFEMKYARMQNLSSSMIHAGHEVTKWFF